MPATALAAGRTAAQRRLSDLLSLAEHGCGSVYLANPDAARTRIADGRDPVLYTAYRDVIAPRGSGSDIWYADLVVYQADDLPGGELSRSIGHWNTPAQLEVFHIVSGRVLLLTAHRTSTGGPDLRFQVCGPGSLAAVPFGAWHLTCALDGPAAVFNLYTDVPDLARPHDPTSRHAAVSATAKYASQPAVEVTAVRAADDGFAVTGSARGIGRWGQPIPVRTESWLRDAVQPGDLAAFFRDASLTELNRLRRLAVAYLPAHTPTPHSTAAGGSW